MIVYVSSDFVLYNEGFLFSGKVWLRTMLQLASQIMKNNICGNKAGKKSRNKSPGLRTGQAWHSLFFATGCASTALDNTSLNHGAYLAAWFPVPTKGLRHSFNFPTAGISPTSYVSLALSVFIVL